MFRNSAKLIKAALITERAQFSDLVSMELDYFAGEKNHWIKTYDFLAAWNLLWDKKKYMVEN